MKQLIALFLLCLTARAFALEVAGVKLDDHANVADANLLLNGAGVRSQLIFKFYVAGLYLDMKTDRVDAVLENAGPMRMTMVMKRDMSGEELVDMFKNGFIANNSPVMLHVLDTSIRDFLTVFEVLKEVKEGDVISIDYVPAYGTHVIFNGVEQGQVEGGVEFYRAFLRIWLGDNPVDNDLKQGLLGG